jgi:hypothetical protein
MVVHGRPALPHESRTIRHFPARRRRGQLPTSTSYTCAAGVLLGVLGELGVSMPWGYREPARPVPPDRGTRLNVPPYLLQLAHEANSYGHVALSRGTP